MMSEKLDHAVPEELSRKVLNAIQGALREEKEPVLRRALKTVFWTIACSAFLGVPFLLSFKGQLNWVWGLAWALWSLCLLAGFALHFYPQPRLMVSGVWSPFVFARLLIVASLATVIQILVCPSFVFLSSPLDWNPFLGLTHALMSWGGMNLCMSFCGFLFALVSGLLGLGSIAKVLSRSDSRGAATAILLVMVAQIPVLMVQALSEDLRPFVAFWSLGLIAGCFTSLGMIRLRQRSVFHFGRDARP
jgi:hypothetical protein